MRCSFLLLIVVNIFGPYEAYAESKPTYTPVIIPEAKAAPFKLEPLYDQDDLDIVWKTAPEGACGIMESPTGLRQELNGNQDDFVFLDLSKIKNSKAANLSLNFFRNNSLEGPPIYKLSSRGLESNGKVICHWASSGYALNELTDCSGEKQAFLGYLNKYQEHYCTVLNTYKISSHKNRTIIETRLDKDNVFIHFEPGNEILGPTIWTKELREKKSYDEKVSKISKYLDFMKKIKESDSFSKLEKCYVRKDLQCLSSYTSNKFKLSMKSFCFSAYSEDIQKEFTYKYIKEFINFINFFETQKLKLGMSGDIDSKLYLKPSEYHDKSAEPAVEMSFKNGVLVFEDIYYGVSC